MEIEYGGTNENSIKRGERDGDFKAYWSDNTLP